MCRGPTEPACKSRPGSAVRGHGDQMSAHKEILLSVDSY